MRLTHADTEVENLFSKRQTKSRREDVMPLPMATGKAIAAYLKHERPKTDSRAVFVRYNAPPGLPVGPDLVRKAIRQAYARAGLPYTRSHLLRHYPPFLTMSCDAAIGWVLLHVRRPG